MAGMMRGVLGGLDLGKWVPLAVAAGVLLYMVGYVDGGVHGAALGDTSGKLNYVHEFFHHARHVALMCH